MLIRRNLRAIALACALVGGVAGARGETLFFEGTDGDGSSWGDPLNWEPFGLPTVGRDAVIDGHTVFVNGNFAAGGLSMDSAAALWIQTNQSLALFADVTNSGNILLNDSDGNPGNEADLRIAGSITIDGTAGAAGAVTFNSFAQNRIVGTTSAAVLTVGAYESIGTGIIGSGEISVNLINHGTISSSGFGTVTIDAASVTNTGLVASSGSGVLALASTNFTNTGGGTIAIAAGGTMSLANSVLSGGVISFGAGSQLNASNSTIAAGATLAGGAGANLSGAMTLDGSVGAVTNALLAISLGTNGTLTLVSNIINNGTLGLNDTDGNGGNFSTLVASGAASLSGSGQVVFQTGNQNVVTQANVSDSLTIGSGQTITTAVGGNGEIRATFVNNGVIDANGGTITIDTNGGTNAGTLRARNAGVMNLNGVIVTSMGTVSVDGTSGLSLSGAAIAGGALNNAGTVTLGGSSALLNVVVGNTGTINLVNGTEPVTGTLHNGAGAGANIFTNAVGVFSGGSVYDNQGTIQLADSDGNGGNFAALNVNGNVVVDGTAAHPGEILFGTGNQNYLRPANGSGDVLTIGPHQSLVSAGVGYVSVNIVNNGMMDAAGAYMELDWVQVLNNGLIHVGSGGMMALFSSLVTGGTETVESGGNLNLTNTTIAGGTINGAGGVNVVSTAVLDGSATPVTTAGVFINIPVNKVLTLVGSINNGATIAVSDGDGNGGNFASLSIDGAVSVSGVGQILFNTGNQNYIQPANFAGDRLTIGAEQTMVAGPGGAGVDFVATTNNGTILGNGGSVTLANNSFVNNGQINATGGGTIVLSGASLANAGGTVTLSGDSTLVMSGASVTGGVVNVGAGTGIFLTNSSVSGGTFATGGTVNVGGTVLFNSAGAALTVGSASVPTNGTLVVQGGLTSVGTLRLADTDANGGNYAYLRVDGTASIDGTVGSPGTILFDSPYQNLIVGTNVGDVLTMGAHETVTTSAGGAGVIGMTAVNNGVIDATGGSILVVGQVTNNNVMRASVGGTLGVSGTSVTNGSAGQVVSVAGGTINLSSAGIVGGTANTAGVTNLSPALINATYTNSGSAGVSGGVSTIIGTLHNQPAGVFTVYTGGELHLRGGSTYDNRGTFTLLDTDGNGGNFAVLRVDGSVTIDGTAATPGVIQFGTANQNLIAPTRLTDVLTIGSHQSVVSPVGTAGYFSVNVNNNGAITSQSYISLASITVNNAGTIAAAAGGTVAVSGATIAGTGTVSIDPAGVWNVSNSTLAGGQIVGGGPLNVSGAVTLDGTAGALTVVAAEVNVPVNAGLYLRGSVVNNGTVHLSDGDSNGGNFAAMYASGVATLGGTGRVSFDTPYQNVIAAGAIGDSLVEGASQTITTVAGGAGEISVGMVNNGTIDANAGGITLDGSAKTNNGVIRATSGGSVNFVASATNFNATTLTGGTWAVVGDSTVRLQGMNVVTNAATIILDGAGSNLYRDNGTTSALANLAVNATGGSISIRNGRNLGTAGAFAQGGIIDVQAGTTFTAGGVTSWTRGTISGDGTYATAGMSVANSVVRSGNGLTIVTGALALAAGAKLDMTRSDLIVDYTGASPAGVIRGYVMSGYNGGAWNGIGINSSAAIDGTTALAVIDNASVGLGSFDGQAIDDTTVLVKFTYYGDANLDGVVNADDYALVDRGRAKSLSGWVNGDFNYDEAVNAGDYLLMDRAFVVHGGMLGPGVLAEREAEFGAGYVSTLMASVPEPVVVLGIVPLLVARRRR